MLPETDVHGTWVRSLVHDAFGRLCWRIENRLEPGSVEFMVVWEKGEAFKTSSAGYHDPEDLEVRPYRPRPWIDNPPRRVVYGEL